MTNYSRTTLRELKKRYLNVLKKCLLANLMAFSMVILSTPATASEDRLVNFGEKTYTKDVTFEDIEHNGYGGAIYNEGPITFGENLTATFTNNSALQGGAIHNKNGAITFGGGATFADNSATSYGGAIYNSGGSVVFEDTDNNTETPAVPNITYSMTFKGDTTFTGNKAESETNNSYGGAIANTGYMLLSGENTFGGYLQDTEDADGDGDKTEYVLDSEGNKISLGNIVLSHGGAIYNSGGKKEGDVIAYGMTLGKSTFMGNTALSYGGAIFNTGYMNFTDEALFDGNKSSVTGGSSHGGAIWNYGTNAVLSFNDGTQFKNNTATATAMEKADGTLAAGYSHGGAISNNGSITFGGLATFDGNSAIATGGNAYGGAINDYNNGTVTFGGLVTFDGNTSSATGGNAHGGAINNSGGSVVFEDTDNNTETPAVPNITYGMTFKGDTLFTGNKAEAETGKSYGGAIYNTGYMFLEGENTFGGYDVDKNGEYVLDSEGNKISLGNEAKEGGAIFNSGGKKEDDVIAYGMTLGKSNFMGNTALSQGGAIWNSGYMNFTDEALFEGNKSSATGGHSYGGAINTVGASAVLTFKDEAQFKNNKATATATEKADGTLAGGNSQGGAIYNSGTITFGALATFEENTSSATGGNAYSGAIRNDGASAVLTFNDEAQFKNNTATATATEKVDVTLAGGNSQGGVIYNNSGTITFDALATFEGNKSSATGGNSFGGAISNSGGSVVFKDTDSNEETPAVPNITYSMTFNGNTLFTGNKAESETGISYGGAVHNNGYMLFEGENTFGGYLQDTEDADGDGDKTEYVLDSKGNKISLGNEAKHGGAIYNSGGKKEGDVIAYGMTLGKSTFMGNTALTQGGAISNSGYMNFTDEALFVGNSTKSQGGAITNSGTITFGGLATFESNTVDQGVKTDAYGGAISNHKNITFKEKAIFKNNEAKAVATAIGGAIFHYGETITFEKGFEFVGNKIINNGKVSNNDIIMYNDAVLNLGTENSTSTADELMAEGGITSYSTTSVINKYSLGNFILRTANSSSNNREFAGIFNQYAGTTIADSDKFFNGTNNITGGELRVHGANMSNLKVTVGENALLTFLSTSTSEIEMKLGDNVSVAGDVKFGADESVGTAKYHLKDDVTAKIITIENADVTAENKEFKGAYIMGENVTLNMQDGKVTDRVKFTNLTGSANLKIDANIVNGENGLELVTDKIATNSDATLKLNLTDVVLSKNALDNGLSDSYTATVMTGGTLTYGSEKGLVATDIYSYEVSGANNQITIDAIEFNEGSDVMESVAEFDGDAAFNMTIGGDSYEMESDVVMTENTKSIVGKGKETSTLTGKKITVNGATLNVENVSVSGENQLIDVASGTLNVTNAKVDNIKNAGTLTANGSEIGALLNGNKAEVTGGKVAKVTNNGTLMLDTAEVSELENAGTLTANGSTIGALVNGNKAEVTGGKATKVTNKGTLMLDTAEVSELENAGTLTANGSTIGALVNEKDAEVTGGKVTKVTNKGELTVTGATITELLNEHEATITGGELETVTNKEKGMLSLSASLRAGTVTNEGELTLDEVTVADLTNSARVKANGSTVRKLVNKQEDELANATVEDLTNTGKMTAKDLTLKGALKGTGTATLSGKLVADDIFKSENKIISDGMEVSENVKKMELADLEIKEGTTLDIGTREVTAKDVTVGKEATLQVTLNNLDEHGTMKADKIEAGAGAGVHLVLGEKFEGGVFDVFKGTKGAGDLEVKHNNLYNVIEVEEGKYSFMTKDTEALQESLGATKEEVTITEAMTKGTSTNPAFNKMQSEVLVALQSLETETVAKAKKALSAVGAKEHPVEQSVASEHLVALQNVVQAELHGAGVGRAGGDTDPRAKVYIKGLYDRTKSSMGEGFRARSKGAVLGVQSEVTEDLTLGVGYATSQTTAKEDLRRTEVDTNTGFVSAHYQPNAWWVSGLATFSRGEYEEEKQVLSSTGKASYDVDSWGAQVMTGYDIKLENAIITPEVGLRYLSVKQEGYTDTLGTTVSGTRSDYLTALVGVKGTWDMGAIRPTAGVTVGYDIISDDVSALNTLANGASYTVNGEALDRLSTTVTTGIEADLGERTTLKLEYSGTYRKEYVDHSGMLKLEVKF